MPRALVLYHYFHPDDVAGAVQMSGLCAGLAARGWDVTAAPCNRGCRDESATYPAREFWNGVRIRRRWRPRFRQSSAPGRLLNALWMIARWSLAALRPGPAPDVVVVGTDPVLGILIAPFWRLFRPKTKIALWCFDLYPEAAYAEGVLRPGSLASRALGVLLRRAYACCDLMADIGADMRAMMDAYHPPCGRVTLVPWAADEPAALSPPPAEERAALFGDARLALLYAGNFGRAHSVHGLLGLARHLRGDGVAFAFSIRGNCAGAVRQAVTAADSNIRIFDFAPPERLAQRLAAADIHAVTLREEWTGAVVPSKFFAALAAGRPVLFCGSPDSSIAGWIAQFGAGWVLTPDSVEEVAAQLRRLIGNSGELARLQAHCLHVYQENFARRRTLDRWDNELRRLTGAACAVPAGSCESPAPAPPKP